mmetsp:Transcript_7733/g.7164  ORF Transcript_7733/g.7164 Transcript_7733/m.7164 type:complete len:156 (-) Transcript_7733:744-1211(-)
MEIDFEYGVFKRVCESIGENKGPSHQKQDPECHSMMNELIFNSNFSLVTKIDYKHLRDFFDEMKKTIVEFIRLEEELEPNDEEDLDVTLSESDDDEETDRELESDEDDEDQEDRGSFLDSYNSEYSNDQKEVLPSQTNIELRKEMEKTTEFDRQT